MSVAHHDLMHELKVSDHKFGKLFEEYQKLTRDIEKMEGEVSDGNT